MLAYDARKYVTGVDYTTVPTGQYVLTLEAGTKDGSFAFKTADGKYLESSTATKSNNYLYATATTIAEAQSWEITITAGDATIKSVALASRTIRYNVDNPRFSTYLSGQTAVQLYKLV